MYVAGELSATILDPHNSKVNVMVLRSPDNNSQTLRFTPRIEGEGRARYFFLRPSIQLVLEQLAQNSNQTLVSISVILCVAGEYRFTASFSTFDLVKDPILCVAVARSQSDKVTVSGLANRDFFARESAEFDIDGTHGGKGE